MTPRTDKHGNGREHIPSYLALQVGGFLTAWVNTVILADVLYKVFQLMVAAVIHLLYTCSSANEYD